MMTSRELVDSAVNIAKNYKTLYVMGCFGSPLTGANVAKFCTNHSYNKQPKRTAMIKAAGNQSPPVFGFDCVCLIKAILWEWSGNASKAHGGAVYLANNVPDINANVMFSRCTEQSTNFSDIELGEALWSPGHIGIYIGNGHAVECTPSWNNCVQVTAVSNMKVVSNYPKRMWSKHGKLPYIKYAGASGAKISKLAGAASKDNSAKNGIVFKTTAALNIRYGPDADKYDSIKVLPQGTKVTWYGYHTDKWYLVNVAGTVGYCHSSYLRK